MSAGKGRGSESAAPLQEALRGNVQQARDQVLAGRATPGADCALRAVCALAHTPGIHAPSLEEVARAGQGSREDRVFASTACVYLELAHFLALDAEGVGVWHELHRSLAIADSEAVASRLGQGWIDLLAGNSVRVDANAAELEREASRSDQADIVLAAAVQNGLAKLSLGDLAAATHISRRAARMARTESLLFHEYTANLLLARVRRHAGRPHFATRIVSALARVLPPPWQRWASWEAFLAGGSASGPLDETLRACIRSAEEGDSTRFDDLRKRLVDDAHGWNDLYAETQMWFAALDARASTSDCEPLEPWSRGVEDTLPYSVRSGPTPTGTVAYAYRPLEGAPRRVLAPGIGLTETATRVDAAGGSVGTTRTLSTVAALLLSGRHPIREATLFQRVYGFAFVPSKHDGVLRTLLHRVRTVLAPFGPVERDDGAVTFRPTSALLCPDPRCDVSLEERVLQHVAQSQAGLTASTIAQTLQIPTKRVHTTLRGLMSEGACISERDGRRVYFRVEDTTFSEPSLHRLGRLSAHR